MDSKTESVGREPRNNNPGAPPWPLPGSGSEKTMRGNLKRKMAKLRRRAENGQANNARNNNNNNNNNRQSKGKQKSRDDNDAEHDQQEDSEESGADDKDAVVKRLANQRKSGPSATPGQLRVAVKRPASNSDLNGSTAKSNNRTIYTPEKSANGLAKVEEGSSNGLTKKQQAEVRELTLLQEVSSSTHFQRYFAVSTVFTGHLDDLRPMFTGADGDVSYWQYTTDGISVPEDKQVCSCCTEEGHLGATCPTLKCSYCSAWNDHFSSSCPKKPEGSKKDSPADIWRTLPKYQRNLIRPAKCIPVSCYLCAGNDHLGDDCKRWSAPIEGAYSVKFLKENGVLDKDWGYNQEGSHKLLSDDPLPEGGVLPDYLANMDPQLGSQPHMEFNPRSRDNSGYNNRAKSQSWGGGGRQEYRQSWRTNDRPGGNGGYRDRRW